MTENEGARLQVSSQDVESVSEKLAALARDLPESERAVLGLVLARAQAAPRDLDLAAAERAEAEQLAAERPGARVFEQPFAGQLARAAGLFADPQVTVIVGWKFRFGIADGLDRVISPARDIDDGPA